MALSYDGYQAALPHGEMWATRQKRGKALQDRPSTRYCAGQVRQCLKGCGGFGQRRTYLLGRAQCSKPKLNSKLEGQQHMIMSSGFCNSRTLELLGISGESESWAQRQNRKLVCPGGQKLQQVPVDDAEHVRCGVSCCETGSDATRRWALD